MLLEGSPSSPGWSDEGHGHGRVMLELEACLMEIRDIFNTAATIHTHNIENKDALL